jgi:RNA polymerase sigma factor (sigma-70 family)
MTYEGLLERISPKLKGITHRLNGCFTYFNEEDLYQEALLHLWQDFQAGKLADKTDSYILQGCYFHLKNYLRKVRTKVNIVSIETLVEGEDFDLGQVLSKDDSGSYSDSLDNKLFYEIIRNNGLTKREKDVLSFYAEGLTVRQIGLRLGISHVRVVKLMARIKDKYRKYRDDCL